MKRFLLITMLVACCGLATACTKKDDKAVETTASTALPTAPSGQEITTVPNEDEKNDVVHPTAPEGESIAPVPESTPETILNESAEGESAATVPDGELTEDEKNGVVHPTAPEGESIATAPYDAPDSKITTVGETLTEEEIKGSEAVEPTTDTESKK